MIMVRGLLAISTPPPSPLISLSPPSAEERLARCLAAPAFYHLTSLLYSLMVSSNHVKDILEAEVTPVRGLCLTLLHEVLRYDRQRLFEGGLHWTNHLWAGQSKVTELAAVSGADTQDIYDYVIEGYQDRQDSVVSVQSMGYGQLSAALGQIQNNMPQRGSISYCKGMLLLAAATLGTAAVFDSNRSNECLQALVIIESSISTNSQGDGSHNSDTGIRGTVRTPLECTYKDFLNCKPLSFKGTEGVVVLSQWFEKMESVFHISNCAVENQVKFATCTFLGNALTWWNSHMKTVTQDVAYAMDWKALKKIMTVKYCLRGKIKKLEIEL
ncbi:hypothetical protein Tco_0942171 [Tanacetum coccineum]